MDRYEVLARIGNAAPEDVNRISHDWLAPEDTYAVGRSPAEVSVFEASCTWRLRAENLSAKGNRLVGSERFLEALGRLNPKKKLLQFSFENSNFSGSVFFEKANGSFVGVAVKDLTETRCGEEFRAARPVRLSATCIRKFRSI